MASLPTYLPTYLPTLDTGIGGKEGVRSKNQGQRRCLIRGRVLMERALSVIMLMI